MSDQTFLSDPSDLINHQTAAYNTRDLAKFTACYAEDCQIFRMPYTTPTVKGRAQLLKEYEMRFRNPALRAEIISTMVMGNKVIEHERAYGILEEPIEVLAIYEIVGGLIQNVWFHFPGAMPAMPVRPA